MIDIGNKYENLIFLKNMRFLFYIPFLFFISCVKEAPFKVGECIERPLGAYTFKVTLIEDNTIYAIKFGLENKTPIKLSLDEEFVKVNCP